MKAFLFFLQCFIFWKMFCFKELKEKFLLFFLPPTWVLRIWIIRNLPICQTLHKPVPYMCAIILLISYVSTVVVMPSSQNLQHGVLQKYLRVHWNTTAVVCSGLIGFGSLQPRKSIRALAFPSHNQQSLQPLPLFTHHLNRCQVHYLLYLNSTIKVFTVSLQFFIL